MGCYCNRLQAREKPAGGCASVDLNAGGFFTITLLMFNESSFLCVTKSLYVPSLYVPSTFFTRTFTQ